MCNFMKKSVKKLLTGMIISSMLSSSFNVLAANNVEIKGISVLENDKVVETFEPTDGNIQLTPEQMLQVTVSVKGDEMESVYASFLSNSNNKDISNATVQYVAQKAIGEDNTATFKFRPRKSVGQGSFIAKSGATGAEKAATFNYMVKEEDKTMTLTGKNNIIKANEIADATFVVTPTSFTGEDYTGFSVYIDDSSTALATDKYKIEKVENELILTVKHENFANKVSGDKIKVTVKHNGYMDASGEITILDAVYNVTLNTNGGVLANESDNITNYTHGTVVTLPTPTQVGYKFEGWYENKDFTGNKVTMITADSEGDKVYYAKWIAETYAISYELNDGIIADGENVTSYTYGVGATLPTPTKAHYKFGGWYEKSDFSGESVKTIRTNEIGAKTYYAKWIADTYKVTLNTQGGTIADDKNITSYEYGTTVKLPTSEDITKADYYFNGWYDNAEFTGTPITEITIKEVPETGNSMIFYAKWTKNEPDKYMVTFENADGTVLQSGDVEKDTMPVYAGATPTKEQDDRYTYVFDKWVPELTSVTGPATYKATYTSTSRVYQVTLNVNDGTIGENVTDYTYGTAVTLPVPTKNGYKFEGWYDNAEFTGVTVTEISAAATGDKTYYAKWVAEQYTITFNTDGGAFVETPISSYIYGTTATLPVPTKNGYKFEGWYDNAEFTGTALTEISDRAIGDKVFYAKWRKESIVENLEVLDAFKNKVDVTKLIDEQGNTTVTVMAKENVTMPELKLYRAIYKGNKLLGTLEEMKPNMVGGNSVFIFAPLTLKDGESSKIMLWDEKNAPTINAIINQ